MPSFVEGSLVTLVLNMLSRRNALIVSLACLLLALSCLPASEGAYGEVDEAMACSRQNSRVSCILGCLKCASVFGRKTYNMASCCTECSVTKAVLVDDGPEVCSPRFFSDSFGKFLKERQ